MDIYICIYFIELVWILDFKYILLLLLLLIQQMHAAIPFEIQYDSVLLTTIHIVLTRAHHVPVLVISINNTQEMKLRAFETEMIYLVTFKDTTRSYLSDKYSYYCSIVNYYICKNITNYILNSLINCILKCNPKQ